MQQKECKQVSEEGIPGSKVDDNERKEKEKNLEQKKKDGKRQSMQQKRGKRVSGEGLPGGKTLEIDNRGETERYVSKTVRVSTDRLCNV